MFDQDKSTGFGLATTKKIIKPTVAKYGLNVKEKTRELI